MLLRMARFGHHVKHRETSAKFLAENPGRPYCDHCLREALSMTRSKLTEKDATLLSAERDFVREVALCSVCRTERRTTRRIPA
jgi:hypothetical protein